jgi:hypothetical protein
MGIMFRVVALVIILGLSVPTVALASDAALLGPQSTTPAANGTSSATTGPASTDSSGLLQPANPNNGSSLQSADADNGGAGQSAAQNALQQPASQDQVKLYIQGDVDNGSSSDNGATPVPKYLLIAVATVAVAIGASLLIRTQRRRLSAPAALTDDHALAPTTEAAIGNPVEASETDSKKARSNSKSGASKAKKSAKRGKKQRKSK